MRRESVLLQIAIVSALARQLRDRPASVEAACMGPGARAAVAGSGNVAATLVHRLGERLGDALASGWIDTVQRTGIGRILVDVSNAQGGMERIKNTPLPIHHQVLPRLFTHLFCLVLPFSLLETLGEMTPLGSSLAGLVFLAILRIGDDLAEPFGGRPHDVPVDTLARTIEINLPASIGCDTPSPLPTSRGVAW